MVAKLMDAGIDSFEVIVNRVSADDHPENQVGVVMYVKNKVQQE